MLQRFGGGVIVPLERATIVVLSQRGTIPASNTKYAQLLQQTDEARAVVSLDWVTECIERDELVSLEPYRVTMAPEQDDEKISGSKASQAGPSSTDHGRLSREHRNVAAPQQPVNPERQPRLTRQNIPNIPDDHAHTRPRPISIASTDTNDTSTTLTDPTDSDDSDFAEVEHVSDPAERQRIVRTYVSRDGNRRQLFQTMWDELELWRQSDFEGTYRRLFERVAQKVSLACLFGAPAICSRLTGRDADPSVQSDCSESQCASIFYQYRAIYHQFVQDLQYKGRPVKDSSPVEHK